MKKIVFLSLLLIGFFSQSNAQINPPAMEVQEAAFTSNPNAYVGKVIKIKNVTVTLPDGPGSNMMGQGKPCTPSNPGLFKMVKLEFNNPNFKGCFEIESIKCNSIPKNLECIGNIIIKVGGPGMNHTILDCKVQP